MDPQSTNALKSATDRPTLKRAAAQFAASSDQADLNTLAQQFATPAFYTRLDTAEDYNNTYTGLRLGQVIKTLMDSPHKPAQNLLLALTTDATYNANILRRQLLIRALIPIRPSPNPAILYWDKQGPPKSYIAYDVFAALVENESPPAMALLEKKFLEPGFEPTLKPTVMHRLILPKRNDEPLLALSDRLLKSPAFPAQSKTDLLESLFDYKSDIWYRGCEIPQPPLRAAATTAAKQIMAGIVQYALATLIQGPAKTVEPRLRLAEKELGKPQQP